MYDTECECELGAAMASEASHLRGVPHEQFQGRSGFHMVERRGNNLSGNEMRNLHLV